MIRKDLEKEYVGKCFEVQDYNKKLLYIIVEHVYAHNHGVIVLEGFGYFFNNEKGLIRAEFEPILDESELTTKCKVLTKEEFLKKLEWFYISDMEKIIGNYSKRIDNINNKKDDTTIDNK